MLVEVSNGEIIDKLTILKIKIEKIDDPAKLENLRREHEVLSKAAGSIMDEADPLFVKLLDINRELWGIEDRIRDLERRGEFGQEFIDTARSVYFTNDKRSEVKREINLSTGSNLIEEKSYEKY